MKLQIEFLATFSFRIIRLCQDMNGNKRNHASTYQIKVQGILKNPLADWLGDIQVIPQERGTTLLVGQFADQPALRGLLDQLWNLNFTVLYVERIENEPPE
jgi:hypothetical protein